MIRDEFLITKKGCVASSRRAGSLRSRPPQSPFTPPPHPRAGLARRPLAPEKAEGQMGRRNEGQKRGRYSRGASRLGFLKVFGALSAVKWGPLVTRRMAPPEGARTGIPEKEIAILSGLNVCARRDR